MNGPATGRPMMIPVRGKRRIVVVGCPGAGKSTFARRLGERIGLPVLHLDRLFWKPGWVQRGKPEFAELLARNLARDRWIVDGNYRRTLASRLARADLAIHLDFPRAACLANVVRRVLEYRGRTRPDLTPGCPEGVDREFLAYIWNFNRDVRPGVLADLDASGVPCVTLRDRGAVRGYLAAR